MAVATSTAILAAAAASAGAGVYGASKQAGAANSAAQVSQQASDASIGLQREIYQQQRADQAPWQQTGVNALSKLGALYGVGGQQAGGGSAPSPSYNWNAFGAANPDLQSEADRVMAGGGRADYVDRQFASDDDYLSWHFGQFGKQEGRAAPTAAPTNAPPGSDPKFADFYASPDYNFRFSEGQRALTASAAARGLMGSGSFAKALQGYGQQTASQEFGTYFNRLASLANIGQTANSATAAAGQNFASNTQNALMQNARNLSSSYADKGNAWAGGMNSLQGAFGDAAALYGYSRGWGR